MRVGLPVKCLPFPILSGLALALDQAWVLEELTMLLEIYEEFNQAEVSARIIGCRVDLPVKCLPFLNWSDLHWLSIEHGPLGSSPCFWKYTSCSNKQISHQERSKVGLPVKCLPFPSWSGLALALGEKGPRGLAPRELDLVLEIS